MEEKNVTEKNTLPPKITKEILETTARSKRTRILYYVKIVFYLLLSSFLISLASYSLIAPNHFTIGGVSGIAILLNVASNGRIPQSIVIFTLNAPLVILSFFFVKKRFAILSAGNIVGQSIWMILLEEAFPTFQIAFQTNGEKIFAAIAAGLCVGTAVALAFKMGGSTGGADIVAVIIQRKVNATSIAWVMFFLNCVIIGISIFVFYDKDQALAYNLLPIMMAAFESYIESKTNDSMTNGFHSAIEFRIITNKPEEMATALMKELSRGVTSLPATGMYTKEERSMLVCVISRRQVASLRRIMKTIDPDSFAVMSAVSQVLGLGFFTNEN